MIEIPTYLYKCKECESVTEKVHGMNERPEYVCDNPEHQEEVSLTKMISGVPLIKFKGGGWTQKDSKNQHAGIPKEVAATAERLGRL